MADILADLHMAVANELLARVSTGEASSGDLSAAIKMLKDNNITISKEMIEENPLGNLLDYLPAYDLLDVPSRNIG